MVSALLTLSCTGLLLLPAAISASTALKKLTPLQKGLNFYKGKTVTFIIPSSVGGSVDQLGRDLSVAMGQYLGATFNVENIPTGNLIPGQDALAASKPDGLTIGEGNIPADILDQLTNAFKGVNFNIAREAFIGSTPPSPNVIVASTKSSIASFKSLLSLPN
ncbi:MAG TPA: hypothetical protein VNF07_09515, partial [Acidimicrobiales bacterium]|nr:hypothetical protein [Acidimicrobiales bacterium]